MTGEGVGQAKRWLKWYSLLAAVPFGFGLLRAWLEFYLILPILVGLAGLYLAAIAVTVRWSIAAWHAKPLGVTLTRRLATILIPPSLLLTAICLFPPLGQAGGRIGLIAQITMYGQRFEEIIAKEGATPTADGRGEFRGVSYWIDPGPPVRVAFFPEGFLDNWSALIYDPTGEMMQADGFDPVTGKFRAADRVTKLFGGDLLWCRPIWGDYYECGFT
ncbi:MULTISPECIES: hypothetical protein [unclassified Sphingomonas]|uniref:hypothetical protein n=1 Tax=unclassified Sphingomonas TaxID=196159 RepID=UPI0021518B28|nr:MULTISPECIES: hypothetical protein [unclassified Sphingomonas]MCR5871381.1 hypothetical protein [Sphingomonas sp. J344]UUY00319.1 hypothetical protein LRS08_04180 [Sphingomonas sp. J315]